MVEGEVSFWMEVSTEYGYDYVSFYIDDQEMGSWSGEVDWFESSYELSAGDHELRWEYEKDFMVESGSDCFWLDDIVLPGISGNLPEVLISDSACLDFELSEGETGTDVIEVWNISNELAQYEIRISGDSHDWLEVVPDEGFIPPGESVDLTVIADPEGYGSGMYEALIAVSDNFGNDMSIIANLEYSSNPSQNEDIFTVSSYNGNYPNPFNPQTTFAFQLAQDQYVDLDIYNLKGQKVRSLVNTILMAGKHQVIWKGRNDEGRMMASGVYLVKVKCEDFESHSRILMLK